MTDFANIYDSFKEASSKFKIYINVDSNSTFKIEDKKNKSLLEIFRQTYFYLHNHFTHETSSNKLNKQIKNLTELKSFGNLLYNRFEKKNNSPCARLAKFINFIIPKFIKRKFPRYFSSNIKQIQASTLEWHTNFCKEIERIKKELETEKELLEKDSGFKNTDEGNNAFDNAKYTFPKPNNFKVDDISEDDLKSFFDSENNHGDNLSNKDEIDDFNNLSYIKQQAILAKLKDQMQRDHTGNVIHNSNKAAEPNQSEPIKIKKKIDISFEKSITALDSLFEFLNKDNSQEFFEGIKEVLKKIHFNLKFFSLFPTPDNIQDLLTKWNLQNEDITVLADSEIYKALLGNDINTIKNFLEKTSFYKKIENSILTYKEASFAVRRMNKFIFYRFKDSNGNDKDETFYDRFEGKIVLDPSQLNDFHDFQKTKPTSITRSIEIRFNEEDELNPESLSLLINLAEKYPFIILKGLKKIDFQKTPLTETEFQQFYNLFPKIQCPELKSFILPNVIKKQWETKELSDVLDFCPQISVLKQCLACLKPPFELTLPPALLCCSILNLETFSAAEVIYTLQHIPLLKHITLSSSTISNKTIEYLVKNKFFDNLESINLLDLTEIDCDILLSLTTLKHLKKLYLPNLNLDINSVSKLPKFDDPFKIATFYTETAGTYNIAIEKYTGPTAWMPVFQIPLARKGVKNLFRIEDQTLDSFSCSLWLYKNDYRFLDSQLEITSLIIENSPYINDDNVVEFIQKFPNVEFISLRNASNITNDALERIIKILNKTKIHTLDLTNCSQINGEIFVEQRNLDKLKKLKKLVLTGTNISSDTINILSDLKKIISFEDTILKISNEQLENFENLFNGKDISKLKIIDFTDCVNLTNFQLRNLLIKLNANPNHLIKSFSKEELSNKELNITTLILNGCTQISDQAFYKNFNGENNAINLLPLGSLSQIIKNETKISDLLIEHYPYILFENTFRPFNKEINPNHALESINLLKIKENLIKKQPEKKNIISLRKENEQFINNRIILNLFQEDCVNRAEARRIFLENFDIYSEQFTSTSIDFKTNDTSEAHGFNIHFSILESCNYLRDIFGDLGKKPVYESITLINQNASKAAVEALEEIFYHNSFKKTLDWETVVKVAQLIKDKCLDFLGNIYQKLLERFHQQFCLSKAEEMIVAAIALEDFKGIEFFEEQLLTILKNNSSLCSQLGILANNFAMKKLAKECARIAATKL